MLARRLAALAALAMAPGLAAAGTVTVKGSDTMVILVQRWAEEFMKTNPGTKVQVTGGGSGTGLSALVNGTTDLAASSRPIKPKERELVRARSGAEVHETAVAKDGVAIYVNERNPLGELSMEQLERIYLGDVANWKEVGGPAAPIVLYSRENSSGTYVFVKEHLLGGKDYAARAQTLPGTAAVVNAIAREPFGIGYGGGAYAKGVKELKVKAKADAPGVLPTAAEVASGRYPLSRDLYVYSRGAPAGEAKAFLDFCLSKAGQDLVERVGYFRVR